jgi:hypothetical protein
MKTVILLATCVFLHGCASRDGVVVKASPLSGASVRPASSEPVCLLPGSINLPHTVVGNVVATKRSYGQVDELAPEVAKSARRMGGNAVFNWTPSQRFKGPVAWRAVAPTGQGLVVFVPETFSCTQLGGQVF